MAQGSEITLQDIEEMHQKIQEISYYEVLGLRQDSFDASQVSSRYRALAKTWHVDRLAKLNLSPEQKNKAQEIFSFITQAQRTLSNDQQREDYNLELEGGGESLDVAALIEADSLFLRGKNTLAQGGYKGALDMFKEAYDLNPDNTSILVYMRYAEYMLLPKNKNGLPINTIRAEELYKEMDEMHAQFEDADWFKVILGVLAEGAKHDRKAIYLYREALLINPSNREAQRQKRLFEMRKDKEQNQSLMDKIKGFFGR